MSGHSKWATIKRKKAAVDAKRGKIFTRLLREIQVAAKMGGGNVEGNVRLKTAVQAAKSQSVPNDSIDRAIKRGAGEVDGADYEDIVYEGYGPGGVAILIKALTDNRNRTVAEVRHAFSKNGGSMANANSVAYLFKEAGLITIEKTAAEEEKIFDVALEAGADDIKDEGEVWEILTSPKAFEDVKAALEEIVPNLEGEVCPVPETKVNVAGEDAEKLLKLLDALDELDDVQSVSANFEMDDADLEAIEGQQ
ncbi:MAG: YebC/PmpR family DNA-binding transcriptional regulator [Bdellovibrionota bacterium]|jgi:YebC/PmpR family DNA-binding regulatory protein